MNDVGIISLGAEAEEKSESKRRMVHRQSWNILLLSYVPALLFPKGQTMKYGLMIFIGAIAFVCWIWHEIANAPDSPDAED